jgi:hypothetical protein
MTKTNDKHRQRTPEQITKNVFLVRNWSTSVPKLAKTMFCGKLVDNKIIEFGKEEIFIIKVWILARIK